MRLRLVLVCALASFALAAFLAWTLDLSLERLILLAPVIVLSFAAGAGLLVLWTRVAVEAIAARRRPPPLD